MSTLSRVGVVPLPVAIRRFGLHFLEMCAVMCAGGFALDFVAFGAATLLGYPNLVAQAPEVAILIIVIDAALAMAVYMALRGHPLRHNLEMSGSTLIGAIALIGMLRLGMIRSESLTAWPLLAVSSCGPLCLLMLIVMVARFDHYGGRVGANAAVGASAAAGEWTCSMHPEVRLAQPGSCPLCGMKLVRRQT